MHYLFFLIAAFIMGCIAAVPAGPVQIEVVRRAVNGNLKPSLMVILGAFIVDIFYGIVAFFGIAPFLEDEAVKVVFWLVGGLILAVLGSLTILHNMNGQAGNYGQEHLKKKRWAFLGGVSLSATNPAMILWWLTGVRLLREIGLISAFAPGDAVSFLVAGSLGLASYLMVLSFFIYWAKKFISLKMLRRINLSFGIFLLVISFYFTWSSLRSLLHYS